MQGYVLHLLSFSVSPPWAIGQQNTDLYPSSGNGFRYAGLEYYGICFCGGTVNGPQVADSECTFPCNGNKNEICGGNNLLSVWQDPTFPTEDVEIGDYKPMGCYTDDSKNGRTLSWPAEIEKATITTEKCLSACEQQGFPLAGTEFGGECWCGNVLANSTAKVDDAQCNMPCKGNAAQTCGGRGRLNVYVAKELESLEPCGHQPPVSSSPISTPITVTTSTSTYQEPPTTSTYEEPPTTSTYEQPPTTSTYEEPPTTTPEPTYEPPTTSSQPPSTTTSTTVIYTPPPVTTTPKPPTTTTSSALCTSTVTLPPKCEWKCGNWCYPPLPDWDNENKCQKAYSTCLTGVASCFKNAGWPAAIECFNFGQWCGEVQKYCGSTCKYGKCNKKHCWSQWPGHGNNPWPGHGGNPPQTTTTVFPCTATSTVPPPTTTKPTECPPPPTNICTQPSNPYYGYAPGKPVGGIALPVVSCNDVKDDWRTNPFKLYIDQNSRRCPSYPPTKCPNACADACKEQWQQCRNVYAKGCQTLGWKGSFKRGQEAEVERRTGGGRGGYGGGHGGYGGGWTGNWGWGDNTWDKASQKCDAQYKDCLNVNRYVNPGKQCQQWGCK